MSVFKHFSRANGIRFASIIRQQGWRAAASRARAYLTRVGALPESYAPQPGQLYLAPFWQDIAQRDAFHVSQAPALLTRTRKIAMIGDLNLPQCRKYRVEQPAEQWAAQGVEYSCSHYEDVPRCTTILQDATHCMFYRTLNTPLVSMYMYEARRLRLPVLYDLDDPLFSISAYETYENMKALPPSMKAHFLNEAPKYLDAMNMADIITVSTPSMRDHTRLYTNRPVHFRRNFADRATFEAANAALAIRQIDPDAPFRVVFASGSMGHEVDFALIAEDIIAFLAADANRELVILGHFDEDLLPEALQDRVEAHKFTSYDKYLETLATVDCAVMPLTDDIFNRCKSAVRVIDAFAVAVPCIVGQVSDMAHMVQDGVTGRVMGPGESWGDALEVLAKDRDACAEMGRAARADLQANWGAKAGLPIIEQPVLDWVLQ